MADLDDSLRGDLTRLRELGGPSEGARRRMWAALEHQIGQGSGGGESEPDGGEAGPSDPSLLGTAKGASQALFAAKVVGATVALTTTGLLVLRAGVLVVRALSPSDGVDAQEQSIAHEATPEGTSRDSMQPPPAEPKTPSAPEPAASRAPSKAQRVVQAPANRDVARDENSLAAELALLQVAHDAPTPQLALAALDEHLRTFPNGQLADERELLRVEGQCKLGQLDAARATAAALLRRHAAMASRVHTMCPTLELGGFNDG